MQHEAELSFFQAILKNANIPCHVFSSSQELHATGFDCGLRALLNLHIDYLEEIDLFLQQCEPNKIYRIQDPFHCRYYLLQVPEEHPRYILVGPFMSQAVTDQELQGILEHYSLPLEWMGKLKAVYQEIPVLSDSSKLLILLNTLGERFWGSLDHFSLQDVYHSVFSDILPVASRPEEKELEDAFLSIEKLEKRYESENQFLLAVSQGQTHKAEMIVGAFSHVHLEQRSKNPLRNLKNYAIIANTLLRKAAEQGHVHPLHIDNLSSRFARSVEEARTPERVYSLIREMTHKYCLLVKNHSMQRYSPLIQKILVRIASDLTADLSLRAQAAYLNVNASYLSTLFKKETGTTLTDYVNQRRVEHGIFLLNSTNLQIQVIAQRCGMPDVNYFTKTFKKYMSQTPTEYRNSITMP